MGTTVIIDFGMGNLGSVSGALRYLGEKVVITSDPDIVRSSSRLVLPGVGSFSEAMRSLKTSGLAEALRESLLEGRATILGICLGMQLLASWGQEGGGMTGIDMFPGTVTSFNSFSDKTNPLHIGFADVHFEDPGLLYRGLPSGLDMYFVHEYRLPAESPLDWKTAIAHHGGPFIASFERENIMGVQYHPEKSQTNGLSVIQNFLKV